MTQKKLDLLRSMGLNSEADALEKGNCPTCDTPVSEEAFTDELSLKEYRISGMCQTCQDRVFGGAPAVDTDFGVIEQGVEIEG